VAFQFTHRGVITLELRSDPDEQLMAVLDAGAEDAVVEDDEMIVYTTMKDLHAVRQALIDAGQTVKEAELSYVPNTLVPIEKNETENKLFRLLDMLDDSDDTVNVYHNADVK